MEVRESAAHALFERSIGDGFAKRGRTPRLFSAEAEHAKRRDHFVDGGPNSRFGCTASLVRSPGLGRFSVMPLSLNRSLRRLALVTHEVHSKRPLGSVLVMRPAAQPDPGHHGPPAARDFLNMIELDKPARLAAVPGFADERALIAVALPDRALDLGRYVAR